jgi:hypothetical protein
VGTPRAGGRREAARPLLYEGGGRPVHGGSTPPRRVVTAGGQQARPAQTPARPRIVDPATLRPPGARRPVGDPSRIVTPEGQPAGLPAPRARPRAPVREQPSRLPPAGPQGVPGRVQSRINIARGRTRFTPLDQHGNPVAAGWEHVRARHFGGSNVQSQFTVSEARVQQILGSGRVVSSPVRPVGTGRMTLFERTVQVDTIIGRTRAADGGGPTSWIRVYTDMAGNLISAFPVPAP